MTRPTPPGTSGPDTVEFDLPVRPAPRSTPRPITGRDRWSRRALASGRTWLPAAAGVVTVLVLALQLGLAVPPRSVLLVEASGAAPVLAATACCLIGPPRR